MFFFHTFKTFACATGLLLGVTATAAAADATYVAARDVVTISGGAISAALESTPGLRVFKGIPYAAAPIGPLRWKPPQPVTAWTGVRRTESMPPACIKGDRPPGRIGAILYQTSEGTSEDCLFLNVWTGAAPRSSDKRPVMLYLHGGGYMIGSGSQPNYNGSGLAAKGAVVVTINYRLGPLGFLAHPELTAESPDKSSGNYALQDAIAALKWVQANAAAFGGDPGNVTVYSESAGAGMASALLGSPLAKGLFHRMMLSSLGTMPTERPNPTLQQAEAAGLSFAKNLGGANLAALRARLPHELINVAGAINAPIVDGWVVPESLDQSFAGKRINDVPLLLGWNADEGTPYPPFARDLAGYEKAATARFGDMADAFKRVYPVQGDADVRAMAFAPLRDGQFAWQPWSIARAHAAHGQSPTYLYFFTRRPPYYPDQRFPEQPRAEDFGAYHTVAQVYFNDNLDRGSPARPYQPADRQLAAAASSYLVNFARSGNPNGDGLPAWPAFKGGRGGQVMVLGERIEAGPVPFMPALEFFDAFYASRLGRSLPF
ncbi:carboxylesterase family protein [Ramlibacter sp. AW1]|uniref:Carboxylesterase family protein n=1 Tax=Ramlibacter aurantiacus TaxID=2801330 RepID=A0A936ZML4_9BURK|nr:carboxylesterase family protein [Ramlibacter aurantiacus]MBL0420055.1 carboxylesterase family protein [Ramlibacter aurantiacus]